MRCYEGDYTNHRWHSLVCQSGVTNSWWQCSMYLSVNKIASVNMDNNDLALLQDVLKKKLSEQALDSLKLNTDTQKCKAINCSRSDSLPKNVTFARNLMGHALSTIHRLNNDPELSVQQKLATVGAS